MSHSEFPSDGYPFPLFNTSGLFGAGSYLLLLGLGVHDPASRYPLLPPGRAALLMYLQLEEGGEELLEE